MELRRDTEPQGDELRRLRKAIGNQNHKAISCDDCGRRLERSGIATRFESQDNIEGVEIVTRLQYTIRDRKAERKERELAILPTVGKKNQFFFKVHAIATVSSDDKLRRQSGVERPNNETITCDTPDCREKNSIVFF